MSEKRKLVHGWRDGRPVVGFEGEVQETEYSFGGKRGQVKVTEKSCLITGKTSNTLCLSPLANGYMTRKI